MNKIMKSRIMIVDDEALILLMWQEALRAEGYEVDTALNGEEAVEIMRSRSPDIVITDMIMPGMSGIELCRHIKQKSPGTEVLLLTGYPPDVKLRRNFIEAGGSDVFLQKPLSAGSLVKTIEKIAR